MGYDSHTFEAREASTGWKQRQGRLSRPGTRGPRRRAEVPGRLRVQSRASCARMAGGEVWRCKGAAGWRRLFVWGTEANISPPCPGASPCSCFRVSPPTAEQLTSNHDHVPIQRYVVCLSLQPWRALPVRRRASQTHTCTAVATAQPA